MVSEVAYQASLCLQPPSAFNFRTPDKWPRWKKRFKQFRLALGQSAEVTVVSEKYAKILSKDLKPPSKRFYKPDSQPLSALGDIQATLTYKKQAS